MSMYFIQKRRGAENPSPLRTVKVMQELGCIVLKSCWLPVALRATFLYQTKPINKLAKESQSQQSMIAEISLKVGVYFLHV